MALYTKVKGDVNYTVVGTPTINNGVVSGFSANDYIQLQQALDTTQPFEIKVKFQVNSLFEHSRVLFGVSDQGIMEFFINASNHATAPNALRFTCGTSRTSFNICNIYTQSNFIIPNKIYYAKAIFTGTQYELWTSEDNTNWSLVGSEISSSLINSGTSITLRMGNGHSGNWYFNDGIIDLNDTYIKVNNKVWFGNYNYKVKVRTGLTKYTVVGSPTIENGIASGFSSSNYLQLQQPFNPSNNKWEVFIKIQTSSSLTNAYFFRSSISAPSQEGRFGIVVSTRDTKHFRLAISTDGTSFLLINDGTYTILTNTDYWIKFGWTGTEYYLDYSIDNITFTRDITCVESNGVYNGLTITQFGIYSYNNAYRDPFNGSIDLNETYIKIGDGYFWRGSHQNINGWKIRYDNLNKNYHIEDGQLTWANPKIYIQNTSTNYIDTGYVAQNNTALIIDFRVDDVRTIASGTRNYICGSDAIYTKPGNFYACFWFQGESASGSRFWLNTTSTGSGNSGSVSSANFILNKYRLILASPYNINYRNSGNTGSASTITQINTGTSVSAISNLESNYGDTSLTVTLFNRNYNLNNSNYYLLGRIYSVEIWEDNNLIKKLVPVPKNLKIGEFIVPINGMFDIVNQQFHPSLGSGNLIYNIDEE